MEPSAEKNAPQPRPPWTCNHLPPGSWHRPKAERGCPPELVEAANETSAIPPAVDQ
jgi:hypothetical protein